MVESFLCDFQSAAGGSMAEARRASAQRLRRCKSLCDLMEPQLTFSRD